MRIVELVSENFMGLEAVDITPPEHLVVVGGKNAQGKSSVLNSIVAALAGGKNLPDVPLKRGERKGKTVLRLDHPSGEIVVERTFGPDGATTLKLTGSDGSKFSKPQQLLDGLTSALGFDPAAFCRLDRKKQAEQLRELVGLDVSSLDVKRQQLYDQRTDVGREAKRLLGALDTMPRHPDAPKVSVSIEALIEEKDRREACNRKIEERKANIQQCWVEAERLAKELADIERQIARLIELRDAKKSEHETLLTTVASETEQIEELAPVDVEAIKVKIANASDTNRKVIENEARAKVAAELKAVDEQHERLTKSIKAIDEDKAALLASAKWPVEGLGFDEHGVTYRGLPFSQASSAEQLKVSLAMGMALNPDLKVLFIREGSLLDDEQLGVIQGMAEALDYQVWIERVSSDGRGCTVVISEGRVAELAAV